VIATPLVINTTTTGNNTLITPAAGFRIKVISFFLVVGGATNVKFTDGAGGSNICGQMNFAANGGIVSQEVHNPKEGEYLMQTSAGTALVLNQSASEQIGGILRYVLSNA
jgi:hypothetical protein